MKKIILFISAVALIGLSSCELDYYPAGTIEQQQAFETVKDAKALRNQIYVGVRNSFNGAYYYATEIQADMTNATLSYGNVNGGLYRWELYSSDYTVRDLWQAPYSRMANINNFLDNIGNITPANDADAATLKLYTAEVHLARAILYRSLILRYAKDYEPSTAAEDLGVPLVLHYDINAKPARATVEQVYQQILTDIAAAKNGLTTTGKQNSVYLTVDCIAALEAQVYLEMHRYTDAITAADGLITSGRYPLITSAATLTSMWTNDAGTETIFQPVFYDKTDGLANATGEYIGYNGTVYSPRFVPEKWVVDLFATTDIRRTAFLKQFDITINDVKYAGVWLINKFPGNPNLFTTAYSNYVNSPKVYHIGEMYLIKAEALAWNGQDGDALDALNELRTKRGLTAATGLTGQALKQEILNERTRELLCEGTRLYDLKRFKLPLARTAPQNAAFVVTTPAEKTINLRKEVGDDLFVWGVPQNDMQTNSNLVQNPGW